MDKGIKYGTSEWQRLTTPPEEVNEQYITCPDCSAALKISSKDKLLDDLKVEFIYHAC